MKALDKLSDDELQAAKHEAGMAYLYSLIQNGTTEERLQLASMLEQAMATAKDAGRVETTAPATPTKREWEN